MVRVDVRVRGCVVWQELPEAPTHKTEGPLHLKEYLIDRAFSKNGALSKHYSPTQAMPEEGSAQEVFRQRQMDSVHGVKLEEK